MVFLTLAENVSRGRIKKGEIQVLDEIKSLDVNFFFKHHMKSNCISLHILILEGSTVIKASKVVEANLIKLHN